MHTRYLRYGNNVNGRFGDGRILEYLAGIPKLVLRFFGKFFGNFLILPKHTLTSEPRLGTPKLDHHQIVGCIVPYVPGGDPYEVSTNPKVNLIEQELFRHIMREQRGVFRNILSL